MGEKAVGLNIRVEPDIREAFKMLCMGYGITMNEAVVGFVEDAIARGELPENTSSKRGAARKSVNIHIRMPVETREAFKALCAWRGVRPSEAITALFQNSVEEDRLPAECIPSPPEGVRLRYAYVEVER